MEEKYDIPGYESYCITKSGRVFRKVGYCCKVEREVKRRYKKNGYMIVGLWEKGKSKTILIHRLLALTFIPNPENKPCVDHINRKPDDNRLENLRWVTYKENAQNQEQKGCIRITKYERFQVLWYEDNTHRSKTFKTREEAEEFRINKMKEINAKLIY